MLCGCVDPLIVHMDGFRGITSAIELRTVPRKTDIKYPRSLTKHQLKPSSVAPLETETVRDDVVRNAIIPS